MPRCAGLFGPNSTPPVFEAIANRPLDTSALETAAGGSTSVHGPHKRFPSSRDSAVDSATQHPVPYPPCDEALCLKVDRDSGMKTSLAHVPHHAGQDRGRELILVTSSRGCTPFCIAIDNAPQAPRVGEVYTDDAMQAHLLLMSCCDEGEAALLTSLAWENDNGALQDTISSCVCNQK